MPKHARHREETDGAARWQARRPQVALDLRAQRSAASVAEVLVVDAEKIERVVRKRRSDFANPGNSSRSIRSE
jgi:hypothetical protein